MSPPVSLPLCLALGLLGWGLLVASLSHPAWGMGGSPGTAVTTLAVTRGLWSDCVTDATGVTSCVPLVSLVSLPGYLQGSRVLAVLAAVLAVPGLGLGGFGGRGGGGGGAWNRPRALGGVLSVISGLVALGASAWFGAALTAEFWDPAHGGVRLEPAPGLLLAGGGGAALGLAGAGLVLSARTGTGTGTGTNRDQDTASPPPSVLGGKYGRNVYV